MKGFDSTRLLFLFHALILLPALFLFLALFHALFPALLRLPILHFLLDQKVKQKIKSHRRRSGKISRFRPDELRCLGDGFLIPFLFPALRSAEGRGDFRITDSKIYRVNATRP